VSAAAVFAFGDLAIRVESADLAHLVWLAEFLGPHFETRADGEYACRVCLIEDQEVYDAALSAGPAAGSLDAFALDGGVVSLPRWRGAETRLHDAQRNAFYDVSGSPRTITILSVPGNLKGRTALMRVVRELATNHAQRAGGLLLHASGFAAGGRGVLVAGPKEAGKTTLLIHALHAPAVEYVSNDRILVPAGAAMSALGVPTIVKLRSGTLGLFPRLAQRLAASGFYQRLTIEEAGLRTTLATGRQSDAPRLSPAQLCRLLDVRARAECEIAAVVFPRVTGDPGVFALRRLSAEEVAARLEDAFFGVRPARWTSDVFTLEDGPPPPDRDVLNARGRALAGCVPGFECRLGLSAYESARAAGDLVAALVR
jgi:hypothetical protein